MSFGTALMAGLLSTLAPEQGEAGSASATKPCQNPLAIPAPLLEKDPRFVVVGEIHGTDTSPEAFGDIVCAMLQTRKVLVQLELPAQFGESINAYVQSGDKAALAEVLDSWLFESKRYDGRGSAAFVALIERMRQMKSDGFDLAVVGAQPNWITIEPQYYYELGMAHLWSRNAAQFPKALNMILVGSYHAKNATGDGRRSAASFLRKEDRITLAPCDEGGTASVLQRDGPTIMELDDTAKGTARGVYAQPSGEDGNSKLTDYAPGTFDAFFCAGRPATASPRAVPAKETTQ